MRLGIKAKQVLGVTTIVGLAVIAVSALYLSALMRVSIEESQARGQLLADAIYYRAWQVVAEQGDPRVALREDPGLRSLLEASIFSEGVMYAAIADVNGIAIAHSDHGREGIRLAPAGDMDDLLAASAFAQFAAIFGGDGRTLEVTRPLLIGGKQFGSIRVGVSTLLMRAPGSPLDDALEPALGAAGVALLIATLVAMFFAQLILRPIHVLRGGLSRLGRGEFGVTLNLPQQDEFGDLGSSFNSLSAQLSADRTQLAGQVAKLESAVEHLEDAVALFNPEGELLFANPAMRATLPPDAMTRPVDDLLADGHPYRVAVEHTLSTRQSRGPVSATIALPEGREAGQAAHAPGERLLMTHAIKDLDDRLLGVMLVARNIEYLSRLQSTINYSRKLVALGRLSAGVAHEVKNPLNAMTIHLELLKQKLITASRAAVEDDGVRAPESNGTHFTPAGAVVSRTVAASERAAGRAVNVTGALEHAAIIAGEIRRLDEVLQGFLKFTRPEDLHLQPFDVRPFVDDVFRVVEPEASAAGVTLRNDCPPDAPDINGDPSMLRQAFLNLALNACQAMPHGGTLRIACAPASQRRVEMTVEDTGVGIPPDHLGRIFDLYFTTRDGGSGIGLSMVYRTVQLHDGEIEVQSTPGRGTAFRILLPQA